MTAFVDELELFRTEEEVAQQYFFVYLSLQSVPGSNPAVLSRLNDTPMFWITTRHALLLAAFVALGRIFDQDARSIHNINKLMRSVSDNIALFTRAGLEQRKIADGLAATVAAGYVKGKYGLTTDDVRGMRKAVAHWRGIYEARYREIRHGVFAHNGLSREDTDLPMAKTNIEEMRTMLGFLHSLHLSLWELYFNGRKPDLTPATFIMPPLARHAGGSLKAGERVYRDSLDVLYGMLSPIGSRSQRRLSLLNIGGYIARNLGCSARDCAAVSRFPERDEDAYFRGSGTGLRCSRSRPDISSP